MFSISSKIGSSLTGNVRVPGDKSISHRALIIGALAIGETTITGLLEGEDVLATASALQQLGAEIQQRKNSNVNSTIWHIFGRGIGGIIEPDNVLDFGNSGTSARLLMGVIASSNIIATITGDKSLRYRPMQRVIEPLRCIGAGFIARENSKLPITIIGTGEALPNEETLKVASAQVKSAILLAGLNAMGNTTVIEPHQSRDHTEIMLKYFGAKLSTKENADGSNQITLTGQPELTGQHINIPGDISSASFLIVAALITPGSNLEIQGVGINPLRIGLLESLKEMGANLRILNEQHTSGEPIADIHVNYSQLKGVRVPAERAPSMIDEYPILGIAASVAEGTSVFEGIGELKIKESNRLEAMAKGLKECGIQTETTENSLTIVGSGRGPKGGNTITTHLDHRIAMSYLVLGLISKRPITIDDGSPIDTSFPGFVELMNSLGANMAIHK